VLSIGRSGVNTSALPCSASLRVSAGRQLPEAKKPWRKIIFFMLAYFVIDFYLGDKDTIFGAFIQLFLKDAGHSDSKSQKKDYNLVCLKYLY
jgi:hypothetical protein